MDVRTKRKRQVVDITESVARQIPGDSGLVHLFVRHTTAAVTTADLDPGTDQDLLDALEGLIAEQSWRHPHDPAHAPDHLIASIIGPHLMVPYRNGALSLGTWQRIVLIECDGPRTRKIDIITVPGRETATS